MSPLPHCCTWSMTSAPPRSFPSANRGTSWSSIMAAARWTFASSNVPSALIQKAAWRPKTWRFLNTVAMAAMTSTEVMRRVIWPQVEEQLGVERDDLPADLKRAVEDTLTSTLARKLKEKLCTKISKLVQDGEEYSRLKPDLSETVAIDGDFLAEGLEKPIRGRFNM